MAKNFFEMYPTLNLANLVQQLKAGKIKQSIFVFDLDSTVFCVSPRSQKILHDFAIDSKFNQLFPEETHVIQKIKLLPTDWGIRSALEREKVRSTINFFELVRDYWREGFFSNQYLSYDQPYEGAVQFIQTLHHLGCKIFYLTGRDVHRMGSGTKDQLMHWSLPLNERNLIMKPQAGLIDEHYKADHLKRLVHEFVDHTVYFFENEPVILNYCRSFLPQVQLIWMDSVHSGREQPNQGTLRIPMQFDF